MGKERYEDKKSTSKTLGLVIGTCLLVLIVIILCLTWNKDRELVQMPEGGNADTTASEMPTNESVNQESLQNPNDVVEMFSAVSAEEGDEIKVSTKYGTLDYPAAFSDVIQIRTEYDNGVSILKFAGQIGNDLVDLFDVCYGETEGELIRQISLDDGSKVSVFMVTYDPPQNMDGDDLNTFYAAQEIVNNVISSIMED